jgi:methionyl-tRNA synthetase
MGKWLITSAWPYINYMPHLGTMIGSVLSADVMARYLRLKGEEVVFVSGSDEHGTPIEVEAIRQGVHPKELTDENHKKISDLFHKWGISFDNYTRTESPVHKKFVQDFCLKIYKNNYVFKEKTSLPFCPTCKRFLPDRFIEGLCPYCRHEQARGDQCDSCGKLLEPTKLLDPYCTICHTSPIIKETEHWYFDLPKFSDELKEYIKKNKQLPDNARKFTLNLIDEGLKPRSLTRDSEWGIPAPFPGAEHKTIYVWMEAVLGYISATIELFQRKGQPERWKDFWFDPSVKTTYFIGKDNIPFHTIILPALLMATKEGYNLPWNVSSTEFLMFEGQKFSKSRRIGVWIDEAIQLYPIDYWRYVLISMRPESKDASFTWEIFIDKVNSDLNDTLGNFIHRTLIFLDRYFESKVPEPGQFDEYDNQVLLAIVNCTDKTACDIEQFRLQAAISSVLELARVGNKYFNDKEPWKTIKADRKRAATTLYVVTQIVKSLAILIEPFMPFTAKEIWKLLNMSGNIHTQNWEEAKNRIPPGHKISKPQALFKKIEPSELKRKITVKENMPTLQKEITAEDFSTLDIRVGKIIECERIPKSSKLLKLSIDIGEKTIKTAVAGIGQFYKPEELKDKLVVVLVNIKSSKIFGINSEVMILAGEDENGVAILQPEKTLRVGSRIR